MNNPFAPAINRGRRLFDRATANPFGDTARRLFKEAGTDDIGGLSAEMAFRLMLAMFPFFIFLAALGGFVASLLSIDNPTQEIMDAIGSNLPRDSRNLLRGELEHVLDNRNGRLLTIGIIGAIWGASAAMSTAVKALNRAYDVEETRSFVHRTALNVGITLLAGVFFVASFTFLTFGQIFAREIGEWVGLEGAAADAFALLRYPAVFIMLAAGTAFLYWAGPNVDIPFRWVSPGALIFIVTWITFTTGFAFYVSNFGSYSSTYGALGNIIVLLVWLQTSSFLLLLGAELNAILVARVAPEAMDVPAGAEKEGEVTDDRHGKGSATPSPDEPHRERKLALPTLLIGAVLTALTIWRAIAPPKPR